MGRHQQALPLDAKAASTASPTRPSNSTRAEAVRTGRAIWVPYDWARSINGVTYDSTGGKFGPFAGQFFLAELMFGGAIIRANVEKVNGDYQGACFPFWGKGLLGPLCLAFDPQGPSLGRRHHRAGLDGPARPRRPVPHRLHRHRFPFEMQSIHVRPRGFRIVFTKPVSAETARNLSRPTRSNITATNTREPTVRPNWTGPGCAIERVEVAPTAAAWI